MTQLTIKGREVRATGHPLLDAGFRPFFLAASIFAIVTILAWTCVYTLGWSVTLSGVSLFHWHAHEMVYGYSVAVVAGFMLTAIERWTGVPRMRGWKLIVLVALWAVPRLLMLLGTRFITLALSMDIVFIIALAVSIARSICLSRQWGQLGVLTKLALLVVGQGCFYLGVAGHWQDGARVGTYLGFYMLIGLILTVARRVVPMFIEHGSDRPVRLFNSSLLDFATLGLFILFLIAELVQLDPRVSGGLAFALFVGHTARLAGWYSHTIWRKPLLWSLYLSIVWIDLGFLLLALSSLGWFARLPALHAMAYGGIGLVTLAMMARVSLGHTGRSVHHPPAATAAVFTCIAFGALIRVGMPWLLPEYYRGWIAVSQLLWLLGFSTFLLAYARILITSNANAVTA